MLASVGFFVFFLAESLGDLNFSLTLKTPMAIIQDHLEMTRSSAVFILPIC